MFYSARFSSTMRNENGFITLAVLLLAVGCMGVALYSWRLVSMAASVSDQQVRSHFIHSMVHTFTLLVARGVAHDFDACAACVLHEKVLFVDVQSCLDACCHTGSGVRGTCSVRRPETIGTDCLLIWMVVRNASGMGVQGGCVVKKVETDESRVIVYDGLWCGAAP